MWYGVITSNSLPLADWSTCSNPIRASEMVSVGADKSRQSSAAVLSYVYPSSVDRHDVSSDCLWWYLTDVALICVQLCIIRLCVVHEALAQRIWIQLKVQTETFRFPKGFSRRSVNHMLLPLTSLAMPFSLVLLSLTCPHRLWPASLNDSN